MNGNLVRDVISVVGAAALLAGLFFVPYADGVAAVGSLLGHSSATVDGLRATAKALMASTLVLLLFVAGLVVVVLYRRHDRRQALRTAASGTPCSIDDVVAELARQPPGLRELVVVGYSLSFAERLRSHLDAHPRSINVRLGLPSDAWVSDNVDERVPIAHRVNGMRKRVDDWRDLEARNRVQSVRVVTQDVAPHWFAIAFADVVFFGSYPFQHDASGRHVLIKNDDRPLYRVDSSSPTALRDAVQRQVECRVS